MTTTYNKFFKTVWALGFVMLGCSPANKDHEIPVDALDGGYQDETTAEKDLPLDESGDDQPEDVINIPQQVGGAFLACQVDREIGSYDGKTPTGCRLQNKEGQKAKTPPADYKLEVWDQYNDKFQVDYKRAPVNDNWHWHLQIPENRTVVPNIALRAQGQPALAVPIKNFAGTPNPFIQCAKDNGCQLQIGESYDLVWGAKASPPGCAVTKQKVQYQTGKRIAFTLKNSGTTDAMVAIKLQEVCGNLGNGMIVRVRPDGKPNNQAWQIGNPLGGYLTMEPVLFKAGVNYVVIFESAAAADNFRIGHFSFWSTQPIISTAQPQLTE